MFIIYMAYDIKNGTEEKKHYIHILSLHIFLHSVFSINTIKMHLNFAALPAVVHFLNYPV